MKNRIKNENKVKKKEKKECPILLNELILKSAHMLLFFFTVSQNSIFSEVWTASSIAKFLSQGSQVCPQNDEESFTAVPPEQSFENYQLDTALIEEGMY